MARRYRVQHGDAAATAEIHGDGDVVVDGVRCTVTPFGPSRYRVTRPDGRVTVVAVAGAAPLMWAGAHGRSYELDVDASGRTRATTRTTGGDMTPPMPATVVKVTVEAGVRVEAGAPVVILEAMKMELTIRAAHGGTVRAVRCAVGDLVRPGTVLVEIESMTAPGSVRLVEVGPRDGLQNEAAVLTTGEKVSFVDALSAAGHRVIEVSAFVSPKWVPQMADAEAVFAGITRRPGVRYTALTPNLAGLERALAARVDEVAVFAAASERFSSANLNQSIDQSLARYAEVTGRALDAGLAVRGYVSCAFGCPFEGAIAPAAVIRVTQALLDHGVYEVAVSDTIGVAHPGQVRAVFSALVAAGIPIARLALHCHDTRGTALANVLAALDAGVATFDAAAGGLGGCPFAPGASGNLATEDLLYMLDGLGIDTGVAIAGVMAASTALAPRLAHPLRSRYVQAETAARSRN